MSRSPREGWYDRASRLDTYRHVAIALFTILAIALHLWLRFVLHHEPRLANLPLFAVLIAGGVPLTVELLARLFRGQFGSDLLAGVSIVTSAILGEYLAGSLVVLMLSGGEALETYAVRSASKVLEALAKRMPSIAHRRQHGAVVDVPLDDIRVGDELVVFPHEVCPVDGTILSGHSTMDESYLTGEPYVLSKSPGSEVLSGAINGTGALTLRATKLPVDSRYSRIVRVMRESEQSRPRLRRLGDRLGAWYTPIAIAIAAIAWVASGDPTRFLSVIVVATPCPLLIAIPVAIIGAISLSARRGIIIKDPTSLEVISECRTAIFDKTGTLTYGRPQLTEVITAPPVSEDEVLRLAGSLEQYSRHPLAEALLRAAKNRGLQLSEAQSISEPPGQGMRGEVDGRAVFITGRKAATLSDAAIAERLPPPAGGLECVVIIDSRYAATLRFRDEPRAEGRTFIAHLNPKHDIRRVMLVSGDRESEVRYLAGRVGIDEVYASQSPEQKVAIVQQAMAEDKTAFIGDGINDAPALSAATVGIAIGQNSDITAEAADAVIMDSSLESIDEFLHIGRRMRRIALQSAVGGMALSVGGMLFAAAGLLPPVAGAITQEVIDVAAVFNALRMSLPKSQLKDF